MTEKAYTQPVAQLLSLGDGSCRANWLDYRKLGLGPEHVPELIRMASDPGLNSPALNSAAVWAPLHAWRALGQLEAVEAVEPLLELLDRLEGDEWALEEIPEVMGLIGPAAIPALRGFIAQRERREFARVGAANGLERIGSRHSASRDACVAALAEQLAVQEQGVYSLNGLIVDYLLDLDGREALSVMEAAFAADCVDEGVVGDWQAVQRHFGVLPRAAAPARSGPAARAQPWAAAESPGQHTPGLFPPRLRASRTDDLAAKKTQKKKLAKASRRKNRKKR